MIDTISAIDCAFCDWAEPVEILATSIQKNVIYDDGSKFAQLGLSTWDSPIGSFLIYPSDKQYFKRKAKVKFINRDMTVIIEKFTKESSGVIRAELSYYNEDEELTDDNINFNI